MVEAWVAAGARGDEVAARALVVEGAELWPAQGPPPAPGLLLREVSRSATWRLDEGRRARAVRRAAGSGEGLAHAWRIAGVLPAVDRATSAAGAVRLLGRALATRDYGRLLALMPAPERRLWDADRLRAAIEHDDVWPAWRQLAGRIAAAVGEPAWVEADRHAVFAFEASTVHIVREGGAFRVLDVRPARLYARPPPGAKSAPPPPL